MDRWKREIEEILEQASKTTAQPAVSDSPVEASPPPEETSPPVEERPRRPEPDPVPQRLIAVRVDILYVLGVTALLGAAQLVAVVAIYALLGKPAALAFSVAGLLIVLCAMFRFGRQRPRYRSPNLPPRRLK